MVTLAFPTEAVPVAPTSSGFLVAPSCGQHVTATTWLSVKWPHLANTATSLVRCSVGRDGDERWQQLSDAELIAQVRRELLKMTGIRGVPTETRVQRWVPALPQYHVGHQRALARIRAALGPNLVLAGAACDGVGVASCIAQGRAGADLILERISDAHDLATETG